MSKLLLEDVMNRARINPKKVKLIRHSLSDPKCKMFYDLNKLKEYTFIQKTGFSKNYDYWMIFLSDKGTTAILTAFYKVLGSQPVIQINAPEGYPTPEDYESEDYSEFELEEVDCLKEYEDCLIIYWGESARAWHQKATNDKEIIAIRSKKKEQFPGYEKVILSYSKLKEIVNEPLLYSEWHTALKSVYGIYLIVDKKSGKQYVGSAYGEEGILQRWTEYVKNKHGGNKKLKELLKEDKNRYKSFQFSILEILSHSLSDEKVIEIENDFKEKLLTKEFGLNDN